MYQPSNRQIATDLLASVRNKLPGTQCVIAAAQAYAVLAFADEVAALRAALQDITVVNTGTNSANQ